MDPTALFGFGHGLWYAPATWRPAISSGPDWPTDGVVTIEVTLDNPHSRPTTEIVQLYLHDMVAETVRPVIQLVAAARVELAAGQARTARFSLPADLTSYTGPAGRRIVDPGDVELRIAASSTDIRQVLPFRLTGPRRTVGADRVLSPTIELSPAGPAGSV